MSEVPRSEPVVLDASAVLALLHEEPGGEQVADVLAGAAISAVNLSEVAAKLLEAGMPQRAAREAAASLGLEVHPFDAEAAWRTARLPGAARPAALSLGDRACLALAGTLARPAVTADPTWAALELEVPVRVIR